MNRAVWSMISLIFVVFFFTAVSAEEGKPVLIYEGEKIKAPEATEAKAEVKGEKEADGLDLDLDYLQLSSGFFNNPLGNEGYFWNAELGVSFLSASFLDLSLVGFGTVSKERVSEKRVDNNPLCNLKWRRSVVEMAGGLRCSLFYEDAVKLDLDFMFGGWVYSHAKELDDTYHRVFPLKSKNWQGLEFIPRVGLTLGFREEGFFSYLRATGEIHYNDITYDRLFDCRCMLGVWRDPSGKIIEAIEVGASYEYARNRTPNTLRRFGVGPSFGAVFNEYVSTFVDCQYGEDDILNFNTTFGPLGKRLQTCYGTRLFWAVVIRL